MRFILTTIFFLAICGCSTSVSENKRDGTRDKEGDQVADQTDDFKKVEEPAIITGANLALSCAPISEDQQTGTYEVGCLLLEDGESTDPTGFDSSEWAYAGTFHDLTIEPAPPESQYHAIYKVGVASYAKASALMEMSIEFRYRENDEDKKVVSRIDTIFDGLANQKHFRFVIKSIRAADLTQPIQYLNSFELLINGEWKTLTHNPITGQLSYDNGPPLDSNGEATDALIFPSIYGMLEQQGIRITPAQLDRFANAPPHDFITEPLWLSYSAGVSTTFSGFRLNGGEAITNHNVATGYPDSFHLETSPDGVNWTLVEGSDINIDSEFDSDIVEHYWSGYKTY